MNMAKQAVKLGGSVKVTIGKRTYSPKSHLKTKDVCVLTGLENAPRDISKQEVKNIARIVKTDNMPPAAAYGGTAFTRIGRENSVNTKKIKVQLSTAKTGQEQTQILQKRIQRGSMVSIKPKTIIREKEVNSGYLRPDLDNVKQIQTMQEHKNILHESREKTFDANKVKLKPATILTGQEKNQKMQSNIQRGSVISVTPQTVIRKKEIQIGHKRKDFVNPDQKLHRSVLSGGRRKNIKLRTSIVTGNEQIKKMQSNIQRGSAISIVPKTVIGKKAVIRGYRRPVPMVPGTLKILNEESQSTIQRDNGEDTLKAGIITTGIGMKMVHTALEGPPYALRVSKGIYNIGNKTIQIARTIDSAADKIKTGVIQIDRQTAFMIKSIDNQKIMQSNSMQRLADAVNGIKTSIDTTRKYRLMVGNGNLKSVSVARGLINGTVQVKISKQKLLNLANNVWYGTKLISSKVGYEIRTGTVNALKTGVKTGRYGVKAFEAGVDKAGSFFITSDDMGIQAVGVGIKSAEFTVKGVKTAPKMIKGTLGGVRTFVFTKVKTGRPIYHTRNVIIGAAKREKKIGLKETVQYFRQKTMKDVKKAAGSITSAIINEVKTVGTKIAMPVILLTILTIAIFTIVTAPVSGVGAIFSGSFTNKTTGEDLEIHAYLINNIESYRQGFIHKILEMQDNAFASGYHYVRLFGENASLDAGTGEMQSINERHTPIVSDDIESILSSNSEIVSIIEPLFQTIVLTQYDLEPTQEQIEQTIQELWDNLFRIETKDLPDEYCYDATTPHTCGSFHASILKCPNMESGRHGTFNCEDCCYAYYCNNIECFISHNDCNGYYFCRGHKIFAIILNMDGIYDLLCKYFTNPIDELANLAVRTPDQEEQLQTLKDNYELCLSYMEEVQSNYGGGSSSKGTDLSGVQFENSSRSGNQAIVDLALQQVGNVGGQPYWSWYGFKGRVAWCACFVSWCINHSGYSEPRFSACQAQGIPWFKNHGQWVSGNYMEPVAGDIIFFDWQPDGISDHVGIVIGNDGQYVYTVEGNSGDTCRTKKYLLNSNVICGYGLPNY